MAVTMDLHEGVLQLFRLPGNVPQAGGSRAACRSLVLQPWRPEAQGQGSRMGLPAEEASLPWPHG